MCTEAEEVSIPKTRCGPPTVLWVPAEEGMAGQWTPTNREQEVRSSIREIKRLYTCHIIWAEGSCRHKELTYVPENESQL